MQRAQAELVPVLKALAEDDRFSPAQGRAETMTRLHTGILSARSSFQATGPPGRGANVQAKNVARDKAHSRKASPRSILVWARSGPAAQTQARWTAALARGLERDVTLVDVIETPWSLSPSQAETALEDQLLDRLKSLRGLSQDEFHNVPVDLQVRLARTAEQNLFNSAKSERRDPIVLWAPVPEHLIRTLAQETTATILVIRSPKYQSELPWVGVADDDHPARVVAQALIRGSREDMSLRLVPTLLPERVDEVPCRVGCTSLPVPGWWTSYLLRDERPAPHSKASIVEVYNKGTPGI